MAWSNKARAAAAAKRKRNAKNKSAQMNEAELNLWRWSIRTAAKSPTKKTKINPNTMHGSGTGLTSSYRYLRGTRIK